MFTNLTLLQMAKKQMDWAARRQEVLAQNVANADTPKYKAQDVKALDFKEVLSETQKSRVQPARTHPMHVSHPPLVDSIDVETLRQPYEASPDGNTVNLDEQMNKVGETRSANELTASLLQKQIAMLRRSIGRGG